jgi:hypothetical protein
MRNGGLELELLEKVITDVKTPCPCPMMGYEKLTNEVIVDGYFHTGWMFWRTDS